MPRKIKTLKDAQTSMAQRPLQPGELRHYLLCTRCRTIAVHDFIPYALGYGRRYYSCVCHTTNNDKTLGHYELLLEEEYQDPATVNFGERL